MSMTWEQAMKAACHEYLRVTLPARIKSHEAFFEDLSQMYDEKYPGRAGSPDDQRNAAYAAASWMVGRMMKMPRDMITNALGGFDQSPHATLKFPWKTGLDREPIAHDYLWTVCIHGEFVVTQWQVIARRAIEISGTKAPFYLMTSAEKAAVESASPDHGSNLPRI